MIDFLGKIDRFVEKTLEMGKLCFVENRFSLCFVFLKCKSLKNSR